MNTSVQQPTKPVVFLGSADFDVERVFPIRNLVEDNEFPKKDYAPSSTTQSFSRDDGGRYFSSLPKTTREETQYGKLANWGGSWGVNQEMSTLSIANKSPPTPEPGADGFFAPPYPKIPPEDLLRPLTIPQSPGGYSENTRRISERAQMVPHIVGAPGVVPGIITGSEPTFYRCEDEPIHIPGAIQQFGALVAIRCNEEGDLLVRIVSENTENIINYSPEALYALTSFSEILEEDYRDDFVARVSHTLNLAADDTRETHLDCFNLKIVTSTGSSLQLWCAIHVSQGTDNLVICEFEEYTTPIFHLDGLHSPSGHPSVPTHTIANEVTLEERMKSVTSKSQPLRVLQLARRRHNSALGSMEVFNAMTQVQQQLASARTVQSVLDMTVGLVSELTGFHRVMLYRFDSHKNGCVVTELVNPKASADLFRGALYRMKNCNSS